MATSGEGLFEITAEVTRFLDQIGARAGAVLIYLRHTSASLVIQENADPDVRTDLIAALRRLAPADAGWVHDVEGPDDISVRAMGERQQALAKISPELREAVILRDLQGLEYAEIRAVLQVPEGTVKSRINRGRIELARILEGMGVRPA